MSEVGEATAEWYRDFYLRRGTDRNDLFNPGVLFQELAYTKCFIRSFQPVGRDSRIIDFGGGDGAGLRRLITLGYAPENLAYIDIIPERVETGKRRLPTACTVIAGDAANCPQITDGSYDVVTASTMFIQLRDEDVAVAIAREMVRVCRPGGAIILFDWVYDFGRRDYRALDKRRMTALFGLGNATEIVTRHKGQLIPPLGRAFSKYAGSLYFVAQAIPFTTGLFGTILRKKDVAIAGDV